MDGRGGAGFAARRAAGAVAHLAPTRATRARHAGRERGRGAGLRGGDDAQARQPRVDGGVRLGVRAHDHPARGIAAHRAGADGVLRHRTGRGQQQHQAIGQAGQVRQRGRAALDVAGAGVVAALLGAPARDGDPLRQVAVAAPRGGQHHQPHRDAADAGLQPHLGADDQRQAALGGLLVGVHHARERALVGDGQRGVAQRGGARHQFLGRRGAGEEAEVAAAVQFGVGG